MSKDNSVAETNHQESRTLRFALSGWRFYKYIRDSPPSMGTHKLRKVATLGMYLALMAVSVYVFLIVLMYQTDFTDLVEHPDGIYEAASLLMCPPRSKTYKFSAFYRHKMIDKLKLPNWAVDTLAHAANTNKLNGRETANKLKPFSSKPPENLWKRIVTGVYNPQSYKWKAGGIDFDCMHAKNKLGKGIGDKNLELPDGSFFKYHCRRLQATWLTDGSYCFLWNNTETNLLFKSNVHKKNRIHQKIKTKETGLRLWLGNLVTDEVVLSYYPGDKYSITFEVEIYKKELENAKLKICQPLFQKCDGAFHSSKRSQWVYVASITQSKHSLKRSGTVNHLDLLEQRQWFEIKKSAKFTNLKVMEAFGNLVSAFIGISFLAIGKVAILFIQFHFKDIKTNLLILTQYIGITLLLIGAIVLFVLDFNHLADHRYLTVVDMSIPTKGIPLGKNIQICSKYISGYNRTFLEEYNISQPLLNYLGVVGVGQIPKNRYIPPKRRSDHFFWDQNATKDLFYHFQFMGIPLQTLESQEFYERKMTDVELEYKRLANKLEISINSPGWEVMKRLNLDKCKIIKFCYINGMLVENCCQHFHYTFPASPWMNCLEFVNEHNIFNQTRPEKNYGLRIILDMNEIKKHKMPLLWYDDHLKTYIKKCEREYNCTQKIQHMDPDFILNANYQNSITNFKLDSMHPGTKIECPLQLIQRKFVKRNGNCIEENYPHWQNRLLKQKLVRQRCGCYICYGFRNSSYLADVPCCPPMLLGRCVTQTNWYNSICKRVHLANPRLKYNHLQKWHVANMSIDIPVNSFFYDAGFCAWREVLKEPKSLFHKDYLLLNDTREIDIIFNETRQPKCNSWSISGYCKYIQSKPSEQGDINGNYLELNFYYPLIQYIQFVEYDILNIWEVLSLLSGGLSIAFGIDYIGFVAMLCFSASLFLKKSQIHSLSAFIERLNNYSTLNFLSRFSFEEKLVNLASSEPPIENGEQETCQKNTNGSIPCASFNNKQNKVAPATLGQAYKIDSDSEITNSNNIRVVKTKNDDLVSGLGIKTKIFMTVIVLSGFVLAIYSCLELKSSLDNSDLSIQFDVNTNLSEVAPVPLGFCEEKHSSPKTSAAINGLMSKLHSCIYRGRPIECHKVFAVFYRTPDFDCLLTNFSAAKHNRAATFAYDYEIELNLTKSVNIWGNGLETIRENNFEFSASIDPGMQLHIRYNQWEMINKEICHMNRLYTCPSCISLPQLTKNQYCCINESLQSFNLTSNPRMHCIQSSYTLETTPSAYRRKKHASLAVIKASTQSKAKRVIRKEARRTISEKFMYYIGFVELFIGLNFSNIIFGIAQILVEKFSSKKQAD